MSPPPRFDAVVVAARPLAPSVRELVFERTDGLPMTFAPGQWVTAEFPISDGERATSRRSYSIASAPDGSPHFELAVTRVLGGPVSTWLHEVELGTPVRFSGPTGFFTRRPDDASPSFFVATGTGVAPLRSMIRAALDARAPAPLWLLLGVRRREDVLYGAEMRELVRAHPQLRFEPTLSLAPEDWLGRRGYVQAHVRELWREISTSGRGQPHAYICGLERMVSSVREVLRKELEVERVRVHSERYD